MQYCAAIKLTCLSFFAAAFFRKRRFFYIIKVNDTGKGMTEYESQHCLDPFFTTKNGIGSGFGLSTVYGIVQRHDGSIEIESQLGIGTSFIICFPFRKDVKSVQKVEEIVPLPNSLRVLIVEDNLVY